MPPSLECDRKCCSDVGSSLVCSRRLELQSSMRVTVNDVERGSTPPAESDDADRRSTMITRMSKMRTRESTRYKKQFEASTIGWFTGSDNFHVCRAKRTRFSYRNGQLQKVLPISVLSACVGIFAALSRKNQWIPTYILSSIEHPYAAQVSLVLFLTHFFKCCRQLN